jgi:hypothetical protein
VVRGWQCAWMILCLGCAGDLRDPKRFDFLIRDAGAKTSDDTGTEPSDAEAPAVPVCATDLFKAKCALSGCHGADMPQVGLDLVSADLASRIVDQPSSDKSVCKGRTYVTTDGTPSLLLDKVSDQPSCGTKMPLGGSLTAAELTCMTDWLQP